VRGISDGTETEFALASFDLDTLIAVGRYGQVNATLDRLDEMLPSLESASDHEALLRGLSGRICLLRLRQTPVPDLITACDLLERAAEDRREPVWTAVAQALRAQTHVDDGDIAAAMGELGGLDLDQLDPDLSGVSGYQLLDVLSGTYTRLRLHDRADTARRRIEEHVDSRTDLERAAHWVSWGVELTRRAIEPLAGGAEQPDLDLLDRAASIAAGITQLGQDDVPDRLLRASGGVRALAAAYRERPSEALRLLAKDAFADPRDLPSMERQVLTLAAMRAHALLGSIATARSLDESATRHVGTLFDTILEVARARERLWLESLADGDVVPVLTRLTELLTRLSWQGMDLITGTARQSLEHNVLKAESRTDALTGVGNRRALDEELRNMLRSGPLPLALILVDIDGFKQVNDHFTHLIGDEVLRRVATALSQQLRLGDKILRYGGDEFVILLPGTADQEAQHVADRMGRSIARLPWSDLAEGLRIGITTGYSSVWSLSGRRPDRDAEMLFRHADEALLAAKTARGQGRDVSPPARSRPEDGWRPPTHREPDPPRARPERPERPEHPEPARQHPEPARQHPGPGPSRHRPDRQHPVPGEIPSWADRAPDEETVRYPTRPRGGREWGEADVVRSPGPGPVPGPQQYPYPPVASFDDDPLAPRTAADRELAPPPEPGRSEVWSRPSDPLTDPAWVDAAITGGLPLEALNESAMRRQGPPDPVGRPGQAPPRPDAPVRLGRPGQAPPRPDAPVRPGPMPPPSAPPEHSWWQEPSPSAEVPDSPTQTRRVRRRPPGSAEEPSYGHPNGAEPQRHDPYRNDPATDPWYDLPQGDGLPQGGGGYDRNPAPGAGHGPPPHPQGRSWEESWYQQPPEERPESARSHHPRRRQPPVIDFPGDDDPSTPFG
jgi:diguanylate cyclase (GGDEF)-like protein